MEISLCAKPFPSYAKSNCHNQSRKFISISCKGNETRPENFYNLLSLSSNKAKIDEIKRAYRTMALKYHPDVCHSSKKEEAEKIFAQLSEAYKVLSDPVAREEYDYRLSLGDSVPNYLVDKIDDQLDRKRWEGQLIELKRQASYRAKARDGSWGSRMRAQKGKL